MKTREEISDAIKEFIVQHNSEIAIEAIGNDTEIVQSRLLTSLQITELILLIEELSGETMDVKKLNPTAFQTIDAIIDTFFPGAAQ